MFQKGICSRTHQNKFQEGICPRTPSRIYSLQDMFQEGMCTRTPRRLYVLGLLVEYILGGYVLQDSLEYKFQEGLFSRTPMRVYALGLLVEFILGGYVLQDSLEYKLLTEFRWKMILQPSLELNNLKKTLLINLQYFFVLIYSSQSLSHKKIEEKI